ncbi:MAG: LamG domain-containing protein [Verrucomicrobiales bacterium]
MKRLFLLVAIVLPTAVAADPIALENRRELFVDDFLIEKFDGAELKLHQPVPQEIAILHDAPWEGETSAYHTVFQDGDLYRMYYRGSGGGRRRGRLMERHHMSHETACYAESRDGIHWTKPELGLFEHDGSTANNIVWAGPGGHNFAPFKDSNPDCSPEHRYKALAFMHDDEALAEGRRVRYLYAFHSSDAIHWQLTQEEPVMSDGAFDSLNVAAWDERRGCYVAFVRKNRPGFGRDAGTATSEDFLNWTETTRLEYPGSPPMQLYTNGIQPYPRAPHLYFGFPMRYVERDYRREGREGYGLTDGVFMTSRDGLNFHRWTEALIRPGLQAERWVTRNNLTAHGLVFTKSSVHGGSEISLYSTEGYFEGDACRLRRFTIRSDGFVSVNAPSTGGQMLTKPLTFSVPPPGTPRTDRVDASARLRVESDDPIRGAGSLEFRKDAILTFAETQNLGPRVTLAAMVRGVPSGRRRLFSTYGGGPVDAGEMLFDIDTDGPDSIRFHCGDVHVDVALETIGTWSLESGDESAHHLAATWDDGEVALYFDGRKVASGGEAGAGDLKFAHGDLRFGEDQAGTSVSNEPFLGHTDDLLVLRRVLSAEDIAELAKPGPREAFFAKEDRGVFLTMDNLGVPLEDVLTSDHDPAQTVSGPLPDPPGDVELLVNFSTSAAGSLRCEIQNADGEPIPGFTLADCDELYGDSLEHPLSWNGVSELKPLAGRPIRLHFELMDADLYALRFGK